MVFTNLTFRALGRTHIASKPCVAIAMLCFDSTVGFPWSVPVLKQRLVVEPPFLNPLRGREGQRLRRGAEPPCSSTCLRPWHAVGPRPLVGRAGARLDCSPRTPPRPFASSATHQTPAGQYAHSALRATPSPEVTELICRLPLPTLSCLTRGCSPWRPVAVCGTALCKPARGIPARRRERPPRC